MMNYFLCRGACAIALPCSLLLCVISMHGVDMSDSFRRYWYDQGAEITRYQLKQSRYGEDRIGDAVLIYVTEMFHTKDQVKSDDASDPQAVPILKLNHIRKFNTGVYAYSVMQSTFQPLDIQVFPHMLKQTCSVQEWCGHIFEQINRREESWQQRRMSYFQAEGDSDRVLGDMWLEDELWTRLRLDPQSIPQGEINMLPSAIYRRFKHRPTVAQQAKLHIIAVSKTVHKLVLVYSSIQRRLEITYSAQFPYSIESWVETDGKHITTARKTHRTFGPYWEWSHNRDQGKRRQLGLP